MARKKRGSLLLDDDLKGLAQAAAAEDKITEQELYRRSIKEWLYFRSIKRNPAARLLVEENGTQREIVLV